MTLNVSMSDGYEVGISYENIKCQQEGDITIRINNEASDTISLRIIGKYLHLYICMHIIIIYLFMCLCGD